MMSLVPAADYQLIGLLPSISAETPIYWCNRQVQRSSCPLNQVIVVCRSRFQKHHMSGSTVKHLLSSYNLLLYQPAPS